MKQITEKQRYALACIAYFRYIKGYPPTVRELSRAVSDSPAGRNSERYIECLEEHGLLEKVYNQPRGLVITRSGWEALRDYQFDIPDCWPGLMEPTGPEEHTSNGRNGHHSPDNGKDSHAPLYRDGL